MVIPDIVNSVYKKLLKHDVTARVFSTRDSRDDEDPPVWPQDGSPAIQNRKIFLRWYLTRLNQDPSKKEFVCYCPATCSAPLTDIQHEVGIPGQSRVRLPWSEIMRSMLNFSSEMHVGAGRRNPLHVDYMFLGICMGYVQDAFTESILTNNSVDLRLRISVVRALGKLIWIQNDLLARWHINENNIGINPNPQPETSGLPRSAAPSPIPAKAHPTAPLTNPFINEAENLSSQHESHHSDSASYASSNKTSLGRNKESLDIDSYSSGSSGGCPFSESSMDSQRAGLGWPLSNSRRGSNSRERPSSKQRGWL
jgi:hypothetical protein